MDPVFRYRYSYHTRLQGEIMAHKIGIVGVGRMGLVMSRNLMAAGHHVVGYRRSAMDDFIAAGGTPAESPAALASACEIVIVSVNGEDAVSDVLYGPAGILTVLRPGQVVVETTSLTPAQKRAHAEKVAIAGGVLLDCPVSGTPAMLEAGRGAFFVSGERAVAEGIIDVLETICPKTTWVGGVGAGAATKSVATALVAIHNLAAAEGLALANREGGDIEAVHRAISGSPAGSAMFELRGALMAKRDYSGGGGALESYARNLAAVHAETRNGGPTPLLDVTNDWYSKAVAAGHTGRDQASIFEYLLEQD
ncbi:MAG: NAD(P)-dependent oxidoreductase [Alphaproteobacteria bacterium]